MRIGRREFLKLGGAALASLLVPKPAKTLVPDLAKGNKPPVYVTEVQSSDSFIYGFDGKLWVSAYDVDWKLMVSDISVSYESDDFYRSDPIDIPLAFVDMDFLCPMHVTLHVEECPREDL